MFPSSKGRIVLLQYINYKSMTPRNQELPPQPGGGELASKRPPTINSPPSPAILVTYGIMNPLFAALQVPLVHFEIYEES